MYVYILRCSDDTYYTGVTNDLERRLWEHQNAEDLNSYTAKRLPVEMIYYLDFYGHPEEAISFEKQLKKWSKAKKEALMRGDIEDLKELAHCRNHSHYENYEKR